MEDEKKFNPNVFISYSWTNSEHEKWVLTLAERLVSDGVDIKIDKWDLKEGNDKYSFMESMVKSDNISNVLLVLDKVYTEKANNRQGGVGTEAQIISPEIYNNVKQEKFIPIIAERDKEGKEYAPIFLKGKIFIDLSNNDKFEESYEALLRCIYKRPSHIKPKLGTPPSYLFEYSLVNNNIHVLNRTIEQIIEQNPKRINSKIRAFLDEFLDNLKNYSLKIDKSSEIHIEKMIYDSIIQYTPLRNEFILFWNKVLKNDIDFDIDLILTFFEKINIYKRPLEKTTSSFYKYGFDNFHFIIHELFLYMIAILLKNGNYKLINELLYSEYFFYDENVGDIKPNKFILFHNQIYVINDYYKNIYSSRFTNPMADIIIKRIPDGFNDIDIVEADLICHYIAELTNQYWDPITSIYKNNHSLTFLHKLSSKRQFEKIKYIFNVNTIDELKNLLNEYQKNYKIRTKSIFPYSHSDIIPIYSLINIENIGTSR